MPAPTPNEPKPSSRHWIRDEHVTARTEAAETLGNALTGMEAVIDDRTLLSLIAIVTSPLTRHFVEPQLLDWARSIVDALDLDDHQRDRVVALLRLRPNLCDPSQVPAPSFFQDPKP